MAKSKPIGIRFDLDKLELIKKKNILLKTHQSILDYLMDFYLKNDIDHPKVYSNGVLMKSTWAKFDTLDVIAAVDSVKEEKALKTPKNDKPEPPVGLAGIDLVIWKSENWK
jgi:hypothetical protein